MNDNQQYRFNQKIKNCKNQSAFFRQKLYAFPLSFYVYASICPFLLLGSFPY